MQSRVRVFCTYELVVVTRSSEFGLSRCCYCCYYYCFLCYTVAAFIFPHKPVNLHATSFHNLQTSQHLDATDQTIRFNYCTLSHHCAEHQFGSSDILCKLAWMTRSRSPSARNRNPFTAIETVCTQTTRTRTVLETLNVYAIDQANERVETD